MYYFYIGNTCRERYIYHEITRKFESSPVRQTMKFRCRKLACLLHISYLSTFYSICQSYVALKLVVDSVPDIRYRTVLFCHQNRTIFGYTQVYEITFKYVLRAFVNLERWKQINAHFASIAKFVLSKKHKFSLKRRTASVLRIIIYTGSAIFNINLKSASLVSLYHHIIIKVSPIDIIQSD